ncbi:reverse transcriptase domain-containing protein [Tanacetum coccineum]
MPFGLRNALATYPRLVDLAFQSQIGRNLEAYVDDMVIKSNDEKMLLANIAETFDNLRRINMKLNPKNCSSRVEEGKFLGYMVTSEGIQENPKKIRALAELQSPRMLKEMQSLSGKLAALNRLFAKLPEQRLRRYFEAHPVKVITDHPIKKIISKTKASGKLEKCVVELGAYNISFEPQNVVKGQVLADFISEAPNGEPTESYFWTLEVMLERDDIEKANVDSKLVASQINKSYVASSDNMIKYQAKEYIACFKSLSIQNIPRNLNQKADVLSKLTSVAFNHLTKEILVKVLDERSTDAKEINTVVKEEWNNWMNPIIQCLEKRIWPKDKNEANYVIREIHMGACEMHKGPRSVVEKAMRQGYYWPIMHKDAKEEIHKCDSCQIHALVPKLPKTLMASIMAP